MFATLGRADQTVVGKQMTVKQHTDRAVLNWQSFDIGKDSAVQFQQPGASSIALNRIAQSDPSKILGHLSANGQVYLINQNGFVFGKDAQVNVNSLTASTLNISDDAFQRGVTKVIDQDGSAALSGNGQVYRRDEKGEIILDASGNKQKISIEFEQGAKVQADTNGRIIAAAPKVVNRGELSAPDGQILLVAASDKVYLQEAGSDSPVRGLLVEVGSGGEVSNLGKLMANRGNITLMGFAVNQSGRVSANTSVRANGSVRLLAREGAATRREGDFLLLEAKKTTRSADAGDGLGTQATVTLGADSLTEASPDASDKTTAVDGQTQAPSVVEIMGQQVRMQQNAVLRSHSGKVDIIATENPDRPVQANVRNHSRIHIDQGAVIDVSGMDITKTMESNVVEVELRSNELRDSPVQKGGVLDGSTVKIDARQGTPIADILGALERIERTVVERSTAGGVLNLSSEGDVIVRPNALLNFAGGLTRFLPGYINTTQLLHEQKLIDIGAADPNTIYTGIQKNSGPNGLGRFESGYVEGKDAGQLHIKANALALDGELSGAAVNGARQRDPALQAKGGVLNIDLARTPDSTQTIILQRDPGSPRNIGPEDPFTADANNPSQPAALLLSGERLRQSGVQTLNLATAGKILARAGERVSLAAGTQLSLSGGEVAVDGAIAAQSGNISINTQLTNATLGQLSGAITLGAGGALDVSGGWVNDRPPGVATPDLSPIFIQGGSVKLSAQGDVSLAQGSRIDVSGGGRRQSSGKLVAGNAGAIKLEAARVGGSNVQAQGEMRGYALPGGQGGSLSLVSDSIVLDDGQAPGDGGRPLAIAPEFFRRGGFQKYALTSNKSGLTIASGAQIAVQVDSRLLDGNFSGQPTGADIASFSHIASLPEISRPAGEITLTLAQSVGQGDANAAVVVEKDAALSVDAGGLIRLVSDSKLIVNGTLQAPAGTISLKATPPVGADPGFRDDQGVWLGPLARLSAAGVAQVQSQGLGVLQGNVLPGGEISLSADRGFVITQPGSVVDVSGTAAVLDLPDSSSLGAGALQGQTVVSDAGRIVIAAAEGAQLQGKLIGQAGGPGAAGGELSVELNPRTRAEPDQISPSQRPFPQADSVIRLAQSTAPEDRPQLQTGQSVPAELFGQAVLQAAAIDRGGFATVALRTPDRIEFAGDLTLQAERSLSLDAPALKFQAEAGTVNLQAAYIALGSTQARPGEESSSGGTGVLRVQAKTLDLTGTLGLQGFGQATLASSGDLRLIGVRTSQLQRDFQGELLTGGDLTLRADRIYPATLSQYRIAISGKDDGLLSIESNGDAAGKAQTPLSAGGALTLQAPNITQAGVVFAPLGALNFNAANTLQLAPGSLTSNSAAGAVIPYGRTQGGLDWLYPLGGQNLVIAAPPEKQLVLQANSLNLFKSAVVDSSGGGDLQAFEFTPGPGGSTDLLDPTDSHFSSGEKIYQPSFAVIPGLSGPAPYDPLETPIAGLKVGDSVHLAGGGGLPAGDYTLLPAHYALLPGAYLVTPQPDSQDFNAAPVSASDGAITVAGYRFVAGTAIRDARSSGFAIASSDTVRLHGEYQTHLAHDFFAKTPAPLPQDAGALRFTVADALSLDGQVLAAPGKQGRGGSLDIEAQNLAIIARSHADQTVAGAVNLIAEDLNQLGIASIALGAVRGASVDGATPLSVKASSVALEQDAQLQGDAFILAARDTISLAPGSSIQALAKTPQAGGVQTYQVTGDAAFLALTAQGQAQIQRVQTQNLTGSIQVEAGAALAASGGLALDASADAKLEGALQLNGGALALGASRIRLGDASSTGEGLALNPVMLQSLNVDSLTLSSASDISLFGAVNLNTQQLTLRAGGILGFDNAAAVLKADSIRLENPQNAQTQRLGAGAGRIEFQARQFDLGAGAYRLAGFDSALFNLTGRLSGSGAGVLTAASTVEIRASALDGGRGADTLINAPGYSVAINPSAASAPAGADTAALGARWSINADRIDLAGKIIAPSGVVALTALQNDVSLAQGALIDVSGRMTPFGDGQIAGDGGTVLFNAAQGNVLLQAGATLDLRGADGGSLQVDAPKGLFQFAGDAQAQGLAAGGDFQLHTLKLGEEGDLSGLAQRLQASGFNDTVSIAAQTGTLNLPAGIALNARGISLNAAGGDLNVAGSLITAGPKAALDLSAGGLLQLSATARLAAQGEADGGGKITLEALNPSGGIVIEPGARLDLHAQTGDSNGILALRAARLGNDVAFTGNLQTALQGAASATLEAVRSYADEGVISAQDIAAYRADTEAYMANAVAIETRLGLPGGLRPGVEVTAPGDLSLGAAWDLLDWRYAGRPGVLSLKAGGDLLLNQALSDGFKAYDAQGIDLSGLLGAGQYLGLKDALQDGLSWSFNLSAGRDLRVGNVVRTGTGAIQIAAGQDFALANAASVVYTAGRPSDENPYGTLKNAAVAFNFYGEYPLEGGDIRIQAGRDVIGARTGQFFDGWMARTGDWRRDADHTGETPTAWAVTLGTPDRNFDGQPAASSNFQQNIGALGGGDVQVLAGRNVRDLSVMIPTTGKQLGTPAQPNDASDLNYLDNQVTVQGGGDLSVQAGGDIVGGVYYTGKGVGELRAAGAITAASSGGLGPVLALGDSQFKLNAGGAIAIGAVVNPTVINTPGNKSFIFTYTADSSLALQSLSGDIKLQNNTPALIDSLNRLRPFNNRLNFPGATASALSVYPASLQATALQGDIQLDRSFISYPAAKGRFELLAGQNILTGHNGDNVNITLSDADPALLPSPAFPAVSYEDAAQRLQAFGDANLIHAQTPVHQGDAQAAKIYAQAGGLLPNDPLLFNLAKPVDARAGTDIVDVSFKLQHADYALSSIQAGGAIRFTSPRNAQGNLVNLTRQIELAGPGQLWLAAGGDIDLGASDGAYTIGNTFNRALAATGASISVFTGLGKPAQFDAFAAKYDPADPSRAAALTAYMRQRNDNPELDAAAALAAYQALPSDQKREFLLVEFFAELRDAASAAAKTGRLEDYNRGFAAIDTLFPGAGQANAPYHGDLKLFFSKIHTLAGGDINLLAPGGLVNAGLAVAFSGAKPASELGIVAQREGQVNAFVNSDFLVNQSRVFSLDGSDIVIWSSNGNIDAGRGAKSAIAAPPPVISFDAQGNLQIEFPPIVSGSGIRTAVSTPGRKAGDVYLAAPRGVVDAGEAGIGGNNVTIAATAVIGASNINVGGVASGVPTANVAPPVTPAGAANAAASAAQNAQQSANSSDADSQAKREQMAQAARLSPLSVEVIGFGECSLSDIRAGKPGCGAPETPPPPG
jgi:filamentous hemagglutinin family protein